MKHGGRVVVYLHADGPWVAGCDCGGREWEVELPQGWMWATSEGPGAFATLEAAMDYAVTLHPGHAHVTPSALPDGWRRS